MPRPSHRGDAAGALFNPTAGTAADDGEEVIICTHRRFSKDLFLF